jgi:hypothetical protein
MNIKVGLGLVWLLLLGLRVSDAAAWGDEGHEAVAEIAKSILLKDHPSTWAKIEALLATDNDELTKKDFVSRATWADKWRDSDRNTTKIRYNATHEWHFIDIDIDHVDFDKPCHGHVASKGPASAGPTNACVVDKINQFSIELKAPGTSAAERRLALKYLLHFVGDVHQPLHAAEHNHDSGGNTVWVLPPNSHHSIKLHAYWDTYVVDKIGSGGAQVSQVLIPKYQSQFSSWAVGSPLDWAKESNAVAKSRAYAFSAGEALDEKGGKAIPLTVQYEKAAIEATSQQIAKAGARLAHLLAQGMP